MDIDKIYDEFQIDNVITSGESIKVREGFFRENDLIKVFSGYNELYFRIDKNGLLDILKHVIDQINQLSCDNSYNYMIGVLNILQKEINTYFGELENGKRLRFYMQNGEKASDEDSRICSLSQIKGQGIAECAEKASVANNILLILNKIGLFNYKVKYCNGIASINNSNIGGHAFLDFEKTTKKGDSIHVIYDITNPEVIVYEGNDYQYPALYCLNNDEYVKFLNGIPFNNTKFIMIKNYKLKYDREYKGFSVDSEDEKHIAN